MFFGPILYPLFHHVSELAAGSGEASKHGDENLHWDDAEKKILADGNLSSYALVDNPRYKFAFEGLLNMKAQTRWSRLSKKAKARIAHDTALFKTRRWSRLAKALMKRTYL